MSFYNVLPVWIVSLFIMSMISQFRQQQQQQGTSFEIVCYRFSWVTQFVNCWLYNDDDDGNNNNQNEKRAIYSREEKKQQFVL